MRHVEHSSAPRPRQGQSPPLAQHGAEAKNIELVGFNDLQARSAYQPVIQNQNGRWIAYVGHHGGTAAVPKPVNPLTGEPEFNGTSIIDVTDTKQPKYLRHIPGEAGLDEAGGAQMVRICAGKGLPKGDPNRFYMLRVFGNSAHEVWDVTNPAAPEILARITGVKGTHKNFWECDSGIAYLVSGAPGWRARRMTQVYDLSDPAKPVFIRNFGLPGQQPEATGDTRKNCTVQFPPAPRAIGCISVTAPTRTACCRSSIAKSCSPVPLRPRTRICSIPKWACSGCHQRPEHILRSLFLGLTFPSSRMTAMRSAISC